MKTEKYGLYQIVKERERDRMERRIPTKKRKGMERRINKEKLTEKVERVKIQTEKK